MVGRGILGILLYILAVVAITIGITEYGAAHSVDPLSLVPADTVAAVIADLRDLRGSGLLEKAEQWNDLTGSSEPTAHLDLFEKGAIFVVCDPACSPTEPLVSGVLTHKAPSEQIARVVQENATDTGEVAGLVAYTLRQGMIAALPDANLVLLGRTPDALASLINTRKTGAHVAPARLAQALRSHKKATIRFALVVTEPIRDGLFEAAPDSLDRYIGELESIAGGADTAGEAVAVEFTVTFRQSEIVRSAVQELNTGLQEAASKMAEQLAELEQAETEDPQVQIVESARGLLETIRVSGRGPELKVSLRLDLGQLEKVAPALLLGAVSSAVESPAEAAAAP